MHNLEKFHTLPKEQITIAFIGTGVMGAPMALHLSEAGYKVHVYNRTYAKAAKLEPKCQAFADLAACVKDADLVISIVGMVKDVEAIYLDQNGILNQVKAGTVVCDMTTSSPALAIQIAEAASKKGIYAIDAPVTGGDKGAREATLSIMVGGDKAVYEAILPIFQCLGTTITYTGLNGCGQHAKLANQIAIAGALAGCAEALTYAKAAKLDPMAVLRVINGGSAASWQSKNNGPKMLSHDYLPGFFLKHITKDLRLAETEKSCQNLPVLSTVLSEFDNLNKTELSEAGSQAIIAYYEQLNAEATE